MEFNNLRLKYNSIIYHSFLIENIDENMKITFDFEIPSLCSFHPTLTLNKEMITNQKIDEQVLKNLVFHIGMIELISYYKCVCPKKVVIEAGYLDEEQRKWFKKLFYNGLGEFMYRNNITISEDELFEFEVTGSKYDMSNDYTGHGNLIPIGGGKDSTVTLEILKSMDNKCFIINPKQVHYDCISEYNSNDICSVKRTIDKELIRLNSEGYLNGHTPFSAIVAFISYLVAYLTERKYIVLSNENSANEPTVLNTNINHQYSKSYEFENDFDNYTRKYFNLDIHYFSLLRPIKEIQIAYLFSNYEKYHKVFKSCNVGSKENPWIWCANCPKCLFVYIMLVAFLSDDEVIQIFNSNMLDNKDLENTFLELIGIKETKPFECVGTIDEVIFALNMYIKKHDELPYLVRLYKDNYYKEINIDLTYLEETNHNVPEFYYELLKEAILNAKRDS